MLQDDGDIDLCEVKKAEQKQLVSKQRKGLVKWLTFILFMAWLRLFAFNFV